MKQTKFIMKNHIKALLTHHWKQNKFIMKNQNKTLNKKTKASKTKFIMKKKTK